MEARVEQCLEGVGRLLSDRRARAESSAGLRRARPASRTKGNAAFEAMEAATQAREQQEEARLAYDQKCQDSADAETTSNDAIKNSLENTEALEKHVKTVTMRAESLATTEVDFCKTLSRPSRGNAKALELTAQLCQTRSAQ